MSSKESKSKIEESINVEDIYTLLELTNEIQTITGNDPLSEVSEDVLLDNKSVTATFVKGDETVYINIEFELLNVNIENTINSEVEIKSIDLL